jgi:NADPH-dependent ferric siderophore reductase
MTDASRPVRIPSTATVLRTQPLTLSMVRIVFRAELDAHDLFADSYVKLRFGDAVRAYTVRSFVEGELTIDFVVHGDEGLAGPWAAAAAPGDEIQFVGPGGAWSPRPSADWHLFIGDDSALPAIASGLERLGDAKALVIAEVGARGDEYPLPGAADVTWVYRGEAAYGERLVDAVIDAQFPAGDVEAFVHGNADAVRPLRRHLLGARGVDRENLSISGYWRAGLTDEAWRAGKREFNAAMEAEAPR